MAHTTWILVANSSKAKLFENTGPKKGLQLLKEMDHPESRQKNAELVTDRAGFLQSSGNGHGARQPQTDPKTHEARNFAHELSRELISGRTGNRCNRIILCAPPAFMGLLNGMLDSPTSQLVSDRLEKDYTKSSDRDLAGHLESCIFL